MDEKVKNEQKTKPSRRVLFQKGNPGGPGRPPAPKCIADLLRWSGGLIVPDKAVKEVREYFHISEATALTVDQACILRSRMEAMRGDSKHLEFWAQRSEGKVTDKLEVSGGQKLEIIEEIVDAVKP